MSTSQHLHTARDCARAALHLQMRVLLRVQMRTRLRMLRHLQLRRKHPQGRHQFAAISAAALLLLLSTSGVNAQTTPPPPMDHSAMMHSTMASDPLGVPMMRAGSGTTWIPDAVQLPTHMFTAGKWDLMLHGFVFGQYNVQSGDRGDSQFGSLNWGMFMASRDIKGGRFQARTMLSIDAATVGRRGYPLLGQSGEAYNNVLVRDRQHPHDFFMELGATYEKPLSSSVGLTFYVAPSGEPALGPVAFMHRPSAMDIPTAPLGHHWQDATHVSFGVLSAGIFTNKLKIEASAFNGREPNQYRWDFDRITLDSYAARLSLNPNPHWALTAGYGYLKSPEALHPDESVKRLVASAMYGRAIGENGQWASTAVFGQNVHGESNHDDARLASSSVPVQRVGDSAIPRQSRSVLVESELVTNNRNTFFGRMESVQKTVEDLDITGPAASAVPGQFTISAVSIGYVRELRTLRGATLGIGAMGTVNVFPDKLKAWYGTSTPTGGVVFLRLRPVLKRNAMNGMSMDGMSMAGMSMAGMSLSGANQRK